jgi:Sec-independent protein translocase protein TatA
MLGLSLSEILIILIIAIIFIKPQDLPEIAYNIGKFIANIRKFIRNLQNSYQDISNEIGVEEIKKQINKGINDNEYFDKDDIYDANDEENVIIIDLEGKEHMVKKSHLEMTKKYQNQESGNKMQEIILLNDQNIAKKNKNIDIVK